MHRNNIGLAGMARLVVIAAAAALGDWSAAQEVQPGAGEQCRTQGDSTQLVVSGSSRGFLFLDGDLIRPPYIMCRNDESETLNGHNVADLYGSVLDCEDHSSVASPEIPTLLYELTTGDGLVSIEGEPVIRLIGASAKYDLWKLVVAADERNTSIDHLELLLPKDADPSVWLPWLESFSPSREVASYARDRIEHFDEIDSENQSNSDSLCRLYSSAYVLTLVGMILSVYSIGHLLQATTSIARAGEADGSADATAIVIRSLLLVLAFSILDLVWTLLASQAGQMRELNPIGSHLIDDPIALIGYKSTITCCACVILFKLRRFRRAQEGAWWACLICTILTFRWLVLNSLFI